MTFSPLPTTLEAAKAEILSLRETYKQSAAELHLLDAEVNRISKLADKWNLECDEMREDNKRLAAEVKTLRDALETIEMWQSHTSKYSIDYGSNGVRELYRDIARQALTRSKS